MNFCLFSTCVRNTKYCPRKDKTVRQYPSSWIPHHIELPHNTKWYKQLVFQLLYRTYSCCNPLAPCPFGKCRRSCPAPGQLLVELQTELRTSFYIRLMKCERSAGLLYRSHRGIGNYMQMQRFKSVLVRRQ